MYFSLKDNIHLFTVMEFRIAERPKPMRYNHTLGFYTNMTLLALKGVWSTDMDSSD